MLDKKDRIIIDVLKENAKLSTQQISKLTAIPVTTVHNRIKKLEKKGVIKGYTVLLDNNKIGKKIQAYILILVDYILLKERNMTQQDLGNSIKKLNEVEHVSLVTGDTDIIVKVRTHDVQELNEFITNNIRKLYGVAKTKTVVILDDLESN